ncbi:hypothetical protein EfaeDRAFT_1500 [Enterococcus faecium DO]|nr:hypothetical protein EfaeDRAFT_1500 [Enterococcus faecium DO]
MICLCLKVSFWIASCRRLRSNLLKISRSNVRRIRHHADLCVAVLDDLLCASEVSCIVGFQTVLCNQGHVYGPLIVHILLNRDEAVLIGEPIQHSLHAVSCEDGVHIIADIEDKAVAIYGQQGIVHLELSHNWHHGIAQLTEAGLLYAFGAVLDVLHIYCLPRLMILLTSS